MAYKAEVGDIDEAVGELAEMLVMVSRNQAYQHDYAQVLEDAPELELMTRAPYEAR